MEKLNPIRIHTVSDLHRLLNLPKPLHPMISLVDNRKMSRESEFMFQPFFLDFYKISYKYSTNGRIGYGQGFYDFSEGGMMFTAPHQLIYADDKGEDIQYFGKTLFIHPDFIRNYELGKNIKRYGFFSYDINEALHLSDKEKNIILGLLENIEQELESAIDENSQDIVISYLEVLLNYSNRFYKRQFITRKTVNHDILTQIEQLLEDYFTSEDSSEKGLPTVEYLASSVNLSPRYLSDMLRTLTGQSTQQHIHEKLIEKAKDYISTTSLSVAEIAYQLGFERPQSFNKLFKIKTNQSPLEFRASFN